MKRAQSAPMATTIAKSASTGDAAPTAEELAAFRTPSFRDLQKTVAYLKGRLADATLLNGSLQRELEILRSRSREEAAYSGKLNQEVAASEESSRAAEAALARETSRSREAQLSLASKVQQASQQQERLQEAAAREERLLGELKDARDSAEAARSEVAELRAISASLSTELRATQSDKGQAEAQLRATKGQLDATRESLGAEGSALRSTRGEAEQLTQQNAALKHQLGLAKDVGATLEDKLRRAEQEIRILSARAQEAAADALGESEARAAAERMAFALREQHSALREERAALHRKLAAKESEKREARHETQVVGAEAHALAVRMGLYRAVLKSDVATILAN